MPTAEALVKAGVASADDLQEWGMQEAAGLSEVPEEGEIGRLEGERVGEGAPIGVALVEGNAEVGILGRRRSQKRCKR